MIFKGKIYSLAVCSIIFMLSTICYAQSHTTQESDQQISDFCLTGYGEKGKKSWDLCGKSADIFKEVVKLKDVVGNLYGKEENVKLTADRGDFNKVDGKVHLEDNVVITTSTGAKLTTDSLDWERNSELLSTKDNVNIQRDNMIIVASGARAEPDLKKVALEKDIRLDINPEKIIITCDGPLEIDYEKNIASFNNNVKVEKSDSEIFSDKMDVYFITPKDTDESKNTQGLGSFKIDRIIARGNVKVIRGDNISYSEEAIYIVSAKKLILTGRPKLIISSTEELNDAPSRD